MLEVGPGNNWQLVAHRQAVEVGNTVMLKINNISMSII